MLWTIIVILVVLWLLGFIGHVGGGLIHLLLVIAVVVLVINLIQGRRGSERIRFRPGNISSASSQSVLHPEDNSSLRSTGSAQRQQCSGRHGS